MYKIRPWAHLRTWKMYPPWLHTVCNLKEKFPKPSVFNYGIRKFRLLRCQAFFSVAGSTAEWSWRLMWYKKYTFLTDSWNVWSFNCFDVVITIFDVVSSLMISLCCLSVWRLNVITLLWQNDFGSTFVAGKTLLTGSTVCWT